jgi:hypothetical protein
MTLSLIEDQGRHIMRQVTAEDRRKAELHCIKEEDPMMNSDLLRNQRAEEEAFQAAVDEDQDDDYVPNSSQNEDDNTFSPIVLVWMMFLMSNYHIYLSALSFEKRK